VFRLLPLNRGPQTARNLQVELTNLSDATMSGTLTMTDTDGIQLIPVRYSIRAKRSRIIDVPMNFSTTRNINEYQVRALVTDSGLGIVIDEEFVINFNITRVVPDGHVTVDGILSEWRDAPVVHLRNPEQRFAGETGNIQQDLRAEIFTMADSQYFYVAAAVYDNRHSQRHRNIEVWQADSLQIAIDTQNGRSLTGVGVTNMVFALNDDGTLHYGTDTPDLYRGVPDFKITRDERNRVTFYEIAFRRTNFTRPIRENGFGINFVINDSSDGIRRDTIMNYSRGFGEIGYRNASLWHTFVFE
jgi:hypothetical protein